MNEKTNHSDLPEKKQPVPGSQAEPKGPLPDKKPVGETKPPTDTMPKPIPPDRSVWGKLGLLFKSRKTGIRFGFWDLLRSKWRESLLKFIWGPRLKSESAIGKHSEKPGKALETEPSQPESREEEILFPYEPVSERNEEIQRRQIQFNLANLLTLFLIVMGFYFLGYWTSPEKFEQTAQTLEEMFFMSKEKMGPVKDKVVDYVETKTQRPLKGEATETPVEEGQSEKPAVPKRKIKYWQAPMNPSYISDQPGKSPMGMDLVPVYEDEVGEPGKIKISPATTQNIGIKTEKVRRKTLTREIRTVGNLTYDERKIHHIHTKYGGWIEKLYVDFTGKEVKENSLLLDIYSPELVSTQEELLLALQYVDSLEDSPFPEVKKGSERLLETTKRRLKLFDVPDHQIQELIKTQKIKKNLHVHSPARGFVIKKNALHGMYVQPGTTLYMIADLSNIWVMADIYEYEVPWVKVGQEAEMSLSYFPGKKFKGKITYIDPFLDPKTRTLKVRMEFANPKWELKPDMYANIKLKSVIAKSGIAVPEQAVIRSGAKDLVIIKNSKGSFESREVSLGVQAEGYYQVLKGLRKGEEVVVSSQFMIDSESRLMEALGKLQPNKAQIPGNQDKPPGKLMLQLDQSLQNK